MCPPAGNWNLESSQETGRPVGTKRCFGSVATVRHTVLTHDSYIHVKDLFQIHIWCGELHLLRSSVSFWAGWERWSIISSHCGWCLLYAVFEKESSLNALSFLQSVLRSFSVWFSHAVKSEYNKISLLMGAAILHDKVRQMIYGLHWLCGGSVTWGGFAPLQHSLMK